MQPFQADIFKTFSCCKGPWPLLPTCTAHKHFEWAANIHQVLMKGKTKMTEARHALNPSITYFTDEAYPPMGVHNVDKNEIRQNSGRCVHNVNAGMVFSHFHGLLLMKEAKKVDQHYKAKQVVDHLAYKRNLKQEHWSHCWTN